MSPHFAAQTAQMLDCLQCKQEMPHKHILAQTRGPFSPFLGFSQWPIADAQGVAGHASYIPKTAAEQIWGKEDLNEKVCLSFLEFGFRPCALAKGEFSVYMHSITPAIKVNDSGWLQCNSRNDTIQSKMCCIFLHSSTPLHMHDIAQLHTKAS